jgi:hypothetical protein
MLGYAIERVKQNYFSHIHYVIGWVYCNCICAFPLLEGQSMYIKSIIEGTIQYIKDITECSDDDYFPCRKSNCKLEHIVHWLNFFIDMHKEMIIEKMIK